MAKRFFREYKLVASEVGAEIKFLKETSCMNQGIREQIAYCEIYKIFEKHYQNEMSLIEFIDKIAIPALKILGFATWNRDILTDMGLRVAKQPTGASLKELRP